MAKDKVVVEIVGDRKKLKDALDGASGDLKKFGDEASEHSSKLAGLGSAAAIGIGGAAVAGAAIAKAAISAASDLNESLSKSQVVFGDSAKGIEAWASTAATALGQSKQQALEAAGTYGSLFQSFGLGQKESADMSKNLVGLASDLASFNNSSPEEALLALRSALSGETEPMKRFGVAISDVRMKSEAVSLGLVQANVDTQKLSKAQETAEKAARKLADAQKKHGEKSQEASDAARDLEQAEASLADVMGGSMPASLTAAQKAQAAYALVMKDTKLAQGDFARTSDGLANKQRILAAKITDLKAQLGEKLLPVFTNLVSAITDKVLPAASRLVAIFNTEGLGGVFKRLKASIADAWPGIKSALANGVQALWQWIQDATPPALRKMGELLQALGEWLRSTGLPALGELIATGAKALWQWIQDAIPPALAQLVDWGAQLGNWLLDTGIPALAKIMAKGAEALLDWIADSGAKLPGQLVEWSLKLVQWIATVGVPKLAEAVKDFVPKMVGWLIDAGSELIPKLAEWLGKLAMWVVTDAIPTLLDKGKDMALNLIKGIGGALTPDFVGEWFDKIKSAIQEMPEKITGAANGMWDGIKLAFRSALNWIIDRWNSLHFELPSFEAFGQKIGGFSIGVPHIDRFAHGGTVPGATGVPRLIIAHGGERISNAAMVDINNQSADSTLHVTLELDGIKLGEVIRKLNRKAA